MVGYNPKFSNLTQKDVAFAGAASGFITRALCQPLDVLKIRFQLQVEPISNTSASKYHSISQALATIAKEERINAFWKGHVPAQFLSITYGFGQFWCFEVLSKLSNDIVFGNKHHTTTNFICGSVAGTFATIISFPFDTVRTRLVAQNETHRVYFGVCHTFYSIFKNEGVLVLFKGLLPTLIQVAPHTGVQFMTYKLFETFYRYLLPEIKDNRTNILTGGMVCGSLAGLCAKTSIYPLDLSKKRLQIQGFERKMFGQNFKCDGLIDCLDKTYKFEGILGLYKGLGPSLIKAVITSALHFGFYELICLEISNFR